MGNEAENIAAVVDNNPTSSTNTDSAPAIQKPPFINAPDLPTQVHPSGVRFDFNDGCRINLPEGNWRARISDIDTGNILFESQLASGWMYSSKKYYVRFRIEVWDNDKSVLVHEYSAKDQKVLVQLPNGTLGDIVGWLPYAIKFQRKHQCKLTCAMSALIIPLFKDAYPEVEFITHEEIKAEDHYATYRMGLFFDDEDRIFQPADFRLVGLHRTAGYILGVDPTEAPPKIKLTDDTRPIKEPYVCIAVQSTTQAKYWNNPTGWREIVQFLKDQGYRVICIDQKPVHGFGLIWNHIPYGAEDQTGDISLQERARWLKHADFFVGLSSGLSWLAWAAEIPVVLISGFTHPTNEFYTPYRIINYHTCNSCWNDVRHRFDHSDFLWCPKHKDTPRQFECTRSITAQAVKAVIEQIPFFKTNSLTNS